MSLKWMSNIQRVVSYVKEVVVTVPNQRDIILDQPYIKGFNMLLVTRNGIEQDPLKEYEEIDSLTIRFSVNSRLRVGDEIRVYFIPNTLSLGDIRVVGKKADLSAVFDPQYNEIAVSVADKNFYIFKGAVWEEFLVPFSSQNVGILFQYEKQVILNPSTRLIEFTNITYFMGIQSILVFVDDNLVDPTLYTEISNQSILFNVDLPIDSTRASHEIEIIAGNPDSWEDSTPHQVYYSYYPDESIQSETIKVGLNTIKATLFEYNLEGNVSKETITKSSKTIEKSYIYDTNGNITQVDVIIL